MAKDANGDIRRAQFIDAAAALFSAKGYNGTSIRDILNAMGDSSPSVFYYYFKSKDGIYQSVLQRQTEKYLYEIESRITDAAEDPLEMIADMLQIFLQTAALKTAPDDDAAQSLNNRMFSAYLHAEVVRSGTRAWERIIEALPWKTWTRKESHAMAAFINGGIDALTQEFSESRHGDIAQLAADSIAFCADVLRAPENERRRFKSLLSNIALKTTKGA